MKINKLIVAALAVTCAFSAAAENVEENSWHISPYFWLPSMDVTSTLGPVSVPIDMGFDEIFDSFDVFAISARAEYWWTRYGVVVDGLWMDMKKDDLGPLGNGKVQISDGIVDVLAAYRFNFKKDNPEGASARLLGGFRYHYLKQELTGGPTNIGGSRDWMEMVLGAQVLAPLGEKWLATARGDVGGFGISDASDITWSAMAGIGWEFASDWLLKLGYRYYYIDYSTGSGLDTFGLEGSMHGPWLGVSYGL